MTTKISLNPTIRYTAQAYDDYCQHPCGCKFHVREEHFSGAQQWVPGTVFQHCDDMASAQQAGMDLNQQAGWEPGRGAGNGIDNAPNSSDKRRRR